MDFRQKEQFIRGLLMSFIPGVIGLPLSICIQHNNNLFLILDILISSLFLLHGTILIIFSLAGIAQKRTKYPQLPRIFLIIVLPVFSILGAALLIIWLNVTYPTIISALSFSIMCWGIVGHSIWYYLNQDKLDFSE